MGNKVNKLVYFCGAGGTGKTSVANKLEQQGCVKLPSCTRAYYASQGIKTELEMNEKPEQFRVKFQRDLLNYFMCDTLNFLQEKTGTIISERSPFCHAAYSIYNHGSNLTFLELMELQSSLRNFTDVVSSLGWEQYVVLFPYPTEWIKDGTSADSMRNRDVRKDYIVSTMMHSIAPKYIPEFHTHRLQEISSQSWSHEIRTHFFL